MSTSSSTESRGSETVEQLIGECFVKTAQAILSSRVYEPPAAGSKERNAKRSAWFKLNLEELESARRPLDRWRVERGVGLPLVLEIYLQPCSTTTPTPTNSEESPGTLVERWYLHYCPSLTGLPLPLSPGGLSRSQLTRLSPQHVYKRLTLLIRSVYSYCRVLPAYKLYRTARASYRSPPFHLKYKLHSTLPQRGDAASTRMQRFEFSPVETADAKLHLVVEYQPASTIKVLGQSAVRLPRQPAIIKDYVKESDSLEKNTSKYLLERGKSQGISSTGTAITAGGDTLLESAPSAPAALLSGGGGGGGTPRRGWSSSFRLSPAKIYEPPVYAHQKYPSPTAPSSTQYGTPGAAAAVDRAASKAGTSVQENAAPPRAEMASPVPSSQKPQQQEDTLQILEIHQHERIPSPFEQDSSFSAPDVATTNESARARGVVLNENLKEGSHISSSPMEIPGSRTTAQYRIRPQGFRSSGDLGALARRREDGGGGGGGDVNNVSTKTHDAATADDVTRRDNVYDKPMSAPAFSYIHRISASSKVASTIEKGGKEENGIEEKVEEQEPARLVSTKVPGARKHNARASHDADSGSIILEQQQHQHKPPTNLTVNINTPTRYIDTMNPSASSSYPVPSSPDLPFAFTPSARYSCSPASVASGSGGGGLLRSLSRPSPPFSGSSGSETIHQLYGAGTPPILPPATQMIIPSLSSSPSSLSGREIPAGTALMRRASWGTRSIRDTTGQALGQNAVGYSVSPIPDTMLESAVLSASTPRQLLYAAHRASSGADLFLGSSRSMSTGGGGIDVSASNRRDPLLLTFPSSTPSSTSQGGGPTKVPLGHRTTETRGGAIEGSITAGGSGGMRLPREDSEQLPFDFTAENSSEQSQNGSTENDSSGGGQQGGTGGTHWQEGGDVEKSHSYEKKYQKTIARAGAGGDETAEMNQGSAMHPPPATTPFDNQSSAASIGAFMRLINEAQPLSGLAPIPIEVGMNQLEALRAKLSKYQEP